jgi:hypothetical protein
MQAGDLVRLSAYGEGLKMFRHLYGLVGLLKEANPYRDWYVVLFTGDLKCPEVCLSRKDIKKVYS